MNPVFPDDSFILIVRVILGLLVIALPVTWTVLLLKIYSLIKEIKKLLN